MARPAVNPDGLDAAYMRRAITLARAGVLDTSPNPMVGCVITDPAGERILGEGWHRRCGEGHAEVNAVAATPSQLLPGATVYVTLEPCSHYGKTPPCARLLVESRVGRVVIGSLDPNEKVCGRGAAMLRDAGIEVTVGVLADECRAINPRFFRAFTSRRPYVTLKWARSADGWMDHRRLLHERPCTFSTPLSRAEVHRLRATHDAIMVGAATDRLDRPALTVRHWPGRSPLRVVARSNESPADTLQRLREEGVTSLLIEGGATILQAYIDAGLWDAARVETAPFTLGERGAAQSPSLPVPPEQALTVEGNLVEYFLNPHPAT